MVYRLPLPSFQESYPATAVKFRTVDIGDINNVAVVACKSLCVFYFSLSLSLQILLVMCINGTCPLVRV